MELQFLDLIRGYVRIRITGGPYDRFLNLCAFHGVRLWQLLPEGEGYGAFIGRKDLGKLEGIVEKSHAAVSVTERHGLPFFIRRYRKRGAWLTGMAAAAALLFWLSVHVWSITVEGNVSQTDDVVYEYLEQSGIRYGMRKADVDCKALAAKLRSFFPRFAWVAAKLEGTHLDIQVKEGIFDAGDAAEQEDQIPSSLAAAKGGTVVSIYVRSGLPVVRAGDTVEPGDLLVSGALPIVDDAGETVSWQYVCADADVVIRSSLSYYDEVTFSEKKKQYTGRRKTSRMVQLGRMSFALPDGFGSLGTYDLTEKLRQLRLSEHFFLPVYLWEITAREYEYVDTMRSRGEILDILRSDFQHFKKILEQKGVQLFENDVKIKWNEKSAIASGTLVTGENAARRVAVDGTEEELQTDEHG